MYVYLLFTLHTAVDPFQNISLEFQSTLGVGTILETVLFKILKHIGCVALP